MYVFKLYEYLHTSFVAFFMLMLRFIHIDVYLNSYISVCSLFSCWWTCMWGFFVCFFAIKWMVLWTSFYKSLEDMCTSWGVGVLHCIFIGWCQIDWKIITPFSSPNSSIWEFSLFYLLANTWYCHIWNFVSYVFCFIVVFWVFSL